MNFQEFKRLCQTETDLYYAFYSHIGIKIRTKIKEVKSSNPDMIEFIFDSGSLTVYEDNSKIVSFPGPSHLIIECFFCYGISSGIPCSPEKNEKKEYAGYIYKPKPEEIKYPIEIEYPVGSE